MFDIKEIQTGIYKSPFFRRVRSQNRGPERVEAWFMLPYENRVFAPLSTVLYIEAQKFLPPESAP